MRRRDFIVALGGAAAARPLAARAQQGPPKTVRIGILTDGPLPAMSGLRDGFRERGYIEGENLHFEQRWAEGRYKDYRASAAELVALGVDAIVTLGTPATLGAHEATSTVPIVTAAVGDALANQVVANLARPGGNTTGFISLTNTLWEKRLELLKAALPTLKRAAYMTASGNPNTPVSITHLRQVASTIGVTIELSDVVDNDLERALAALARSSYDAVLVSADAFLRSRRARVAAFMAERRLPAIYASRDFVEAGGLMALGPNYYELFRRAAGYVDRIIKGVKTADLPMRD
jgi:putative tryptophan/tyrosine transport system substrate-binding protein